MSEPICICGKDVYQRPGMLVELGTVLGFGMEPGMRYARLVGIRHNEKGLRRFVVHEYNPEDGYFPTSGRYRTTWLIVPWQHDHPTGGPVATFDSCRMEQAELERTVLQR